VPNPLIQFLLQSFTKLLLLITLLIYFFFCSISSSRLLSLVLSIRHDYFLILTSSWSFNHMTIDDFLTYGSIMSHRFLSFIKTTMSPPSRLPGHTCSFHEYIFCLGISSKDLSSCLDYVSCLVVITHMVIALLCVVIQSSTSNKFILVNLENIVVHVRLYQKNVWLNFLWSQSTIIRSVVNKLLGG
jgi:hypothetical protein